VRAPRANAIAERQIASARREWLDRMLITSEQHLRLILSEYTDHYNLYRPRRARNLRPPDSDDITMAATTGLAAARIRRRRVLGGLINEYRRAA
jgi:putative transposase